MPEAGRKRNPEKKNVLKTVQTKKQKKRRNLKWGPQFQEQVIESSEVEELDESVQFEDFTEEEDNEYSETQPLGITEGKIRPVWIYIDGRILWCNRQFGFHIRFCEGYRWMIESFLREINLLGGPFRNPSPSLLFGFFPAAWIRAWPMISEDEDDEEESGDLQASAGKNSLSTKLKNLNTVGIILPGFGLFPLSVFWAGPGKKTISLPKTLERIWVRDAFAKRGLDTSFTWKDVKDWLPGECERFADSVQDLLQKLLPRLNDKDLPKAPDQSTLQKKKLKLFRKYLSEGKLP